MAYKQLKRNPANKVIAGVCGGLGDYFDVDPVIFRIVFTVLFFAAGGGALIYILLWIVLPKDNAYSNTGKTAGSNDQEGSSNFQQEATDATEEKSAEKQASGKEKKGTGALIIGICMIISGILFMFQNYFHIYFRDWWPMILIVMGVAFLFPALTNKNQ